MKFEKVLGKVDQKLVEAAEAKLSKTFLDLATRYNNTNVGSGMGGDAFIFSLMYPVQHICTLSMPTAATDGKRFYWNPKFVLKQSLIGLRMICAHEAWHAIYMHPQRRGSRLPKLWNIAVDYIVNGMVMEDLKARHLDPKEYFNKYLGRYMTLPDYCKMLKDPWGKIPGFDDIDPNATNEADPTVQLPKPNEDRELTEKEIKELERREKAPKFFFADPDLEEDMKRPEKIYELLYNLLPKCPKCGSVGIYQKPKNDKDKKKDKNKGKDGDKKEAGDKGDKKDKGKGKEKSDQHDHGDGEKCDCKDHGKGQEQGDPSNEPGDQPGNGDGNGQGDPSDQGGEGCGHCDTCGDGIDVFDMGGTVDEHMDSEESEQKLAKRISDAMRSAKEMAGHVPAGLEDELGQLTAPKVTWQDVLRGRITKAKNGNGRNDWNRFRTRPQFVGLMVPKRITYTVTFGCLLDTSGSMSKDDMAYGISQLQGLDDRAEGTITPVDCSAYWKDSTKIKKCDLDELTKVKVTGRGGTRFAEYMENYEKEIGKCDFIVVLTDGFLSESDMVEMRPPPVDVFWIITSDYREFKPPFGRVMKLKE